MVKVVAGGPLIDNYFVVISNRLHVMVGMFYSSLQGAFFVAGPSVR